MPLDSDQLAEIRRLLEQKRDTLLGEAGAEQEAAAGTTKKTKKKKKTTKKAGKKSAKKGGKKTTKRRKSPIETAVAHELNEVENALKRLDAQQERFGYCERCFMEIPWSELVANAARRCCSRCV